MINAAIPGWIAVALFLVWLITHVLMAIFAHRQMTAMRIKHFEGPDEAAFMRKLFFAIADKIGDQWWIKIILSLSIYGSMGFFFIWLHFISL